MNHAEAKAVEAARGGATIYGALMEIALAEPRDKIERGVEKSIRGMTANLGDLLVEQLRHAYIAGVADGYRDAGIKSDENEAVSRCRSIIAGLLTMVYSDHGEDGGEVVGLADLIAAAKQELSPRRTSDG